MAGHASWTALRGADLNDPIAPRGYPSMGYKISEKRRNGKQELDSCQNLEGEATHYMVRQKK